MLKILVVDDEPDVEIIIRQKFRRRIRDRDLDFVFAGDGVEALEHIEAVPDIDLVLSDINMPRMDGLSLLSHIQELDRLLKVVMVSAYGDLHNIRTAMNGGAFDFVTKPIDFDDLERTIEKSRRELEALRHALTLQKQFTALQRELEIASKIQLSALPSHFPAFPDRTDFDLYAMMIPAQEVGGDFYDFFLIDEDHLGFAVGDVSGKGIAAALLMAITRTMLRATALGGLGAGACLTHVNRVLHPETVSRMFVTLVYGILDTRTGVVEYANAGHCPPYVIRHGGAVESLPRTGGLGLCLKGDFQYRTRTVTLAPGDWLFLYTDGVTEAVDAEGRQFEGERLAACLCQPAEVVPGELVRTVLRSVVAFCDGVNQADDITMLALRYEGGR